jgi:divalent metal cation (Fe/Co/Zn/Cd) transporter
VRSRGTPWAVELDLHMQVASDMKVEDAHSIANRVEAELRARLPALSDVVVHIEPIAIGAEAIRDAHAEHSPDHSKNP